MVALDTFNTIMFFFDLLKKSNEPAVAYSEIPKDQVGHLLSKRVVYDDTKPKNSSKKYPIYPILFEASLDGQHYITYDHKVPRNVRVECMVHQNAFRQYSVVRFIVLDEEHDDSVCVTIRNGEFFVDTEFEHWLDI